MVTAINKASPRIKARITIFPHTGHISWNKVYNSSGMGTGLAEYDPFDRDIYTWLLQFKKENER